MAEITPAKRLLSYFMELPLEVVSSAIHPELKVSLQQGRLQLSTAKAIYSFSDLYTNFRRAFSKIRIEDLHVEDALLLGLGLGSIPEMLEKKFGQTFHYTAVELDEVIIDLAQRYTLCQLKSTFDIYCTDAHRFVLTCPSNRFQLICVDLFIEDQIPEPFTETIFMENLARILTPDGLLLFNCFSMEASDRRRANWVFQERFLPAFPDATYIETGTNWILVSQRSRVR